MRAYPSPKFGVSSPSGSRDSRGHYMPPSSRARNSQTLSSARVNPRPCAAFYSIQLVGGGVRLTPPAVRPLMVLELRGKNERVACNERMPMVSDFMVLRQPVTSEVRSNARCVKTDQKPETPKNSKRLRLFFDNQQFHQK